MRLSIRDLAGDELLAGSVEGAALLSKLIPSVATTSSPGVVYLDFSAVRVATGSYLRESVLGFRDYCRRSRPELYPVVANPNEKVLDELRYLLKEKGDAVVVCELAATESPSNARVLGILEEKQTVTLLAVLEAGEADAASLRKRARRSESISLTGWNNRLASLSSKGLLIETRRGRSKWYRPVMERMTYGS